MGVDALVPLEHHLLALCLATESNQRSEWPLIAAVIQNRVRSKRYPDTFPGVILQRSQFSAFNVATRKGFDASVSETWPWVFRQVAKSAKVDALLLAYAIDHAAKMIEADADGHRLSVLISPQTMHYWSPVSMKPAGSRPAWAPQASRLYTPEGIDPQRFVFAENVP
jgi:hypothetical protein